MSRYFPAALIEDELPLDEPAPLPKLDGMPETLVSPKALPNLSRRSHAGEQASTLRRAWLALSAGLAAFLGLLPHVLHHAGPLAGAALLGGLGGSLLFGAIGFLAAIPFLIRMHHRFGTWRAPATALALFAAVFSVSTFVFGPAISGDGTTSGRSPPPSNQAPATGHEAHHQ